MNDPVITVDVPGAARNDVWITVMTSTANARTRETPAASRRPARMAAGRAAGRRRAGGNRMKTLVICNDPPYGTERSWNGLRLAGALARRDGEEVRVLLLGDAVGCAVAGQQVPDSYYHLDQMISSAERHGAEVGCCATCLDARGITGIDLLVALGGDHPRTAALIDLARHALLWSIEAVSYADDGQSRSRPTATAGASSRP